MALHLIGNDAAELVRSFLAEDIGSGDVTTQWVVPEDASGRAAIEAREACVVAGLPVAELCFALVDPAATSSAATRDGARVQAGEVLMRTEGPLAAILTGERTALNLLAHLSGIATLTRRFVDAVEGTNAVIVDTRKTTPGLRDFEKYAVTQGGGRNHRLGLYDAVLIKDNHLKAAGGIAPAVAAARNHAPDGMVVQVEVTTIDELDQAFAAGAEAILLDNMDPEMVAAAVERTAGRAVLEASGGIHLDNVRAFAESGVDRISIGALTHSAPSIDLALEVE